MSPRPTARPLLLLLVWLTAGLVRAAPQPPHDLASGIECLDCHVPYAGLNDPASAVGTASGGSTTTLSDGAKAWTPAAWVGGVITFTSGANLGQFRPITANAAASLTWALPLPAPVAAGDGYSLGKTTHEDIETRCKSCHNPTGSASTLVRVGLHAPGGGVVVGCGKCHDPHNVEPNSGVGNRLIRTRVRWPTAAAVTAYPSGGANRLLVGAGPFNGICETCHTDTGHHRNNASADHGHNAGQDCTASCHRHVDGFGTDCLGCHTTAQDDGNGVPSGGRRAVVGEFPSSSAHAHYGATLDQAACKVCHSLATHGDGFVEVIDPDNASRIFRFSRWADLTSDPDVSTFCLGCHDADGAQRLATPLDPFRSGNRPPDEASRFSGTLRWEEQYSDGCFGADGTWRRVNSHHDISTADQLWSGAKVECLNCHGAHQASSAQPLIDPRVPSSPWTGTANAFCLTCHAGGAGPVTPNFPTGVVGPTIALRGIDSCGYNTAPWWVEYAWTNEAHGGDSKRGWPGYSGAPSRVLDCVGCHDPHGSYTPANPAGNPYMIRDGVDGTASVDDGTRGGGFNGPPWTTFGVSRSVTVSVSGLDVDWGSSASLCSTCHTNWQAAYSWHSMCTACQTCHGHGQSFGGNDWGPAPSNATACP